MPRRRLLTAAERDSLLSFPETDDALIQHYTFSEADLSAIRQRRSPHNRFGFAVQLCYLRYPGIALPTNAEPPASFILDTRATLIDETLIYMIALWARCSARPSVHMLSASSAPARN